MNKTIKQKKTTNVKKHRVKRDSLPQQDRFKFIFVMPLNSPSHTVAFRRYTGPKYGHGHF